MSGNYRGQARRFVCGGCSMEFSTLPDLTYHADFCFANSSDQQQQQQQSASTNSISNIRYSDALIFSGRPAISSSDSNSRNANSNLISTSRLVADETASAVETLQLYSNSNTENLSAVGSNRLTRNRLSHNRSIDQSAQNRSIDLAIDQSTNNDQLFFDSNDRSQGAYLIDDDSPPRNNRRKTNVSLNGIQVTAGSLNLVEYRGLAGGVGPAPAPASAPAPSKSKSKTAVAKSKRRKKKKEDAVDLVDQNESALRLDELVDEEEGDSNFVAYPEMDARENFVDDPTTNLGGNNQNSDEYLNSILIGDKQLDRSLKEPDNFRQKWRYLPADMQNLRTPDGRMKKWYRVHCPVCQKVIWRQNLKQHMRLHNGQRPYKCRECPRSFAAPTDLKRHSITHQDRKNRKLSHCQFCDWTGISNLRRHVRQKHPGAKEPPPTTRPPAKKAAAVAKKATRRKVDFNIFPAAKVIDDDRFDDGGDDDIVEEAQRLENELAQNVWQTNPKETSASRIETVVENVFQAIQTGTFRIRHDDDFWMLALERVEKELNRDPDLLRKKKIDVPRIECNICLRVISRNYFKNHQRIHDNSKPFECTVCSRTFRCRQIWRQHVKEHFDRTKKSYRCSTCGKTYSLSSTLRNHRSTTHPDEIEKEKENADVVSENREPIMPFRYRKSICHICGLMIAQTKIKAHLKLHDEGPKTYDCDRCSKKYSTDYFLRLHKARVHEGVMPYKCLLCDFRAERRERVVKHMWDVHREMIDDRIGLIHGISTFHHLPPTRKCFVCDVLVFRDNYELHQKKHDNPKEFEELKRKGAQLLKRESYAQRVNRVDDSDKQESAGSKCRKWKNRTAAQKTAKRILDVVRRRRDCKFECFDHDYVATTVEIDGVPRRSALAETIERVATNAEDVIDIDQQKPSIGNPGEKIDTAKAAVVRRSKRLQWCLYCKNGFGKESFSKHNCRTNKAVAGSEIGNSESMLQTSRMLSIGVQTTDPCTKPKWTRHRYPYTVVDGQDLRLSDGGVKNWFRIHCPVCQQIIWRQNLSQHMRRRHADQRTYKCDRCPKAFAVSTDLQKHSETHRRKRDRIWIRCSVCPWIGLTNLRRHMREKHPGVERPVSAARAVVEPKSNIAATNEVGEIPNLDLDVDDQVVEEARRLENESARDAGPVAIAAKKITPKKPKSKIAALNERETRSKAKEQMKSPDKVMRYQCLLCNKAFANVAELVEHDSVHS